MARRCSSRSCFDTSVANSDPPFAANGGEQVCLGVRYSVLGSFLQQLYKDLMDSVLGTAARPCNRRREQHEGRPMVLVELIDFISISHAASNRKTIEPRSFVYLDESLRWESRTEGILGLGQGVPCPWPPAAIAGSDCTVALGKRNQKVDPWPSSLVTQASPPWFKTMCFTIASPRPVPPASRERALSTR